MTWVDTRLKHVCVDAGQYGLNISAENYVEAGTRLIRTSDVSSNGTLIAQGGVYVDVPLEPRHSLRRGDILLSRSGTLGRSFLVPHEAEGQTFAGFLVRFRPKSSAEPRYLYYATLSETFQGVVKSEAVSSTIQNFNAERYANVSIRVPPLEEQRRIADFLDVETSRIDDLSALRNRQVSILQERRWSDFQERIDSTRAPIMPLRRIIDTIIDGPFGSAFSSDDYVNDGAVVVRLGNIGFAEYRAEDQARIPATLFERFRRYGVEAGDVLIAGLGDARNHAGRACVAPDLGEAIVKGKCFRMRVVADASPIFVALLLSSPIGASSFEGRGSTRSMINLEIVKAAQVPIPAAGIQREIAAAHGRAWDHMCDLIGKCQEQVRLLGERRQALITAAVTGQFDVTTASGRNLTQGV